MRPTGLLAAFSLCVLPTIGHARQPAGGPLPPPEGTPQLVINHAGPHAPIQSLAFGPDGTLYAGGFGKLVHRYVRKGGEFVAVEPIRVPLGPGNAGAVNAVAVSPDGKWVAVAGRAPIRGELWSGQDDGITVETRHFPQLLKQDYGVVYLFNPADPQGGKVIRGPESGVRAIAFANPAPADGPVLVTAGVEWGADGKQTGVVRVFDATTGKELANPRTDLPAFETRAGLAAWASGEKGKTLRVAVAWPGANNAPGKLLVWETTTNRVERFDDGRGNFPLAVRVGKAGAEQIISGGLVDAGGQLVFRPADPPADGKPVRLGAAGQYHLPVAAATAGDGTAVVAWDLPTANPPDRPIAPALWLLGPNGGFLSRTPLTGADTKTVPPLAASPDGRCVAVAGFADNRIEVYDADGRADNKQTLAGAPGGFAQVAFLAGNRLWLGGPNDAVPRGGLVVDFATRKAADGREPQQVDAPAGSGPVPWMEQVAKDDATKDETITLTVAAGAVKFTLHKNEKPTAVAYLPAGPAWDKQFGAVLAVAHHDAKAAVTLITLFDAADGRRLLQLGGPTLRIDGLAFCGSRPLLAAVGADRVVSVWSLKNVAIPFAAIEGITLVERGGELAVASVEPTSPARDALKPDAVIEAVGGEKGDLKPVKTYREFLLAVRAIGVGNNTRLRLKGVAAPVVVPVGRGVGHRHPLFELWVNPTANKDGSRDWIGWTPAGPYDANSEAAEARLGWLNTTGNPAEPVRYAGVGQYRRAYYKPNFIRFLIENAEFDEALRKYVAGFRRTPPTLIVRAGETEQREGLVLIRTTPTGLDVRLDDPDRALLLDKAVLRWRLVGRDDKPGNWQDAPFTGGRATLPLGAYVWSRGPHRFEVALHETADGPAAVEAPAAFHYVPPPPVVTLRVNGEKVVAGTDPTSAKETVEVSAEVEAAPGAEVVVALTHSGPGGADPVRLPAGKVGQFGPLSVKLPAEANTTIRVTATNAAAGEYERFESHTATVTVGHAVPQPKPVPRVRLTVASPVDQPAIPGDPFVSDASKVRLSAAVTAEKVEKLEWDDGDGKWVEAEFKPADPKAPNVARDITIGEGGKPRTLRVRVTAAGGASRIDAVKVVWAGLPEVDFADLPAEVRVAELTARGTIRRPPGGAAFTLQLVVESPNPDVPRRVVPITPHKPDAWEAETLLTPGENRVGLVVGNPWKQVRFPAREVRYLRPPLVAAVAPIAARADGAGDVIAAVISPSKLPPHHLIVAGRTLPARPVAEPIAVGGLSVWWLKAEGVPLEADGVLPKTVRVAAGNVEGDGPVIDAVVLPKPVIPPPPPPRITVTHGPDAVALAPGNNIRTDQPRLFLAVKVNAPGKLTQVELRRTDALPGQQDRVPGLDANAAVALPNGFELTAKPELPLREGVNQFELVASAGETLARFPFSISFTPPPIRVEIDGIDESLQGKPFAPLLKPAAGTPYQAAEGFVRVRGRVIWSGTGDAARGAGHEIILVANDVRHLPVELAAPPAGSREAAFVAPLFLNAADTQVRVEVHARGQAGPLPQQKVADVAAAVHSPKPIREQRLHVLVIAPQVREDGRTGLARQVMAAVGGEFPADRPVLHRMPFKHKAFARATLYAPLVQNVSKPGIHGLLEDVEDEIRKSAAEPGPRGWVNDVVLVYYQGRDMPGKDGLLRLHTTRSSSPAYAAGGGEQFAVRMDELPPTPGVRLSLLNVIDPGGAPRPAADPLAAVPLLLRYVWKDQGAAGGFLPLVREGVAQQPTVGGVADWICEKVKDNDRSGPATITLTPAVRERLLGGGP